MCQRIYILSLFIVINDMGELEEYIKQRHIELRILYKLILDVDAINDDHMDLFNFVNDMVSEYEKVNNCLVKDWLTEEGISDENYVLEDRLVNHSFNQNLKSVNDSDENSEQTKKIEFIYSKTIYDVVKLLENDSSNKQKLDKIKEDLVDYFPRLADNLEICYMVVKEYLKKEDRSQCFEKILNDLESEWRSRTSLDKNPKANKIYNRIIKYAEILGADNVSNKLLDIWKKKELN